jgi:hypothetical protein
MLGIPDFIRTLYHNILDRSPDRAESQFMITHWTKHAVTHDLAATINEFFVSDEFLGKNHSLDAMVHSLYRSILGREPEIEEKNHWLYRLKQADAMHTIIDHFIASPEYRYKAKIGATPNPAYVNSLPRISQAISHPLDTEYASGTPLAAWQSLSGHYTVISSIANQRAKKSFNSGQLIPSPTAWHRL